MADDGVSAFTVFRFTCERCHTANEFLYRHRASVRPHLVSTSCQQCRTVIELNGLTGTLISPDDPDAPRDDASTSAASPSVNQINPT